MCVQMYVCVCMSLFCECMYLSVCTYFMCFCLASFSCLCLLPCSGLFFLFYFIVTIILVPICFLMREKGKAWIWVGEEVARTGEELRGGETVIGIYCVKKINEKRNNTIAYCPYYDLQVCSLTASACLQMCSL